MTVLYLHKIGSKLADLLGVMAIREREEMRVWAGLRGPSKQVSVGPPSDDCEFVSKSPNEVRQLPEASLGAWELRR